VVAGRSRSGVDAAGPRSKADADEPSTSASLGQNGRSSRGRECRRSCAASRACGAARGAVALSAKRSSLERRCVTLPLSARTQGATMRVGKRRGGRRRSIADRDPIRAVVLDTAINNDENSNTGASSAMRSGLRGTRIGVELVDQGDADDWITARARDLRFVTRLVIMAPKSEMSRATNRAISERYGRDLVSTRFQRVLVSICCDEPPARKVPRAGSYDRRHDPSRAHGNPCPATRSRRGLRRARQPGRSRGPELNSNRGSCSPWADSCLTGELLPG